MKHILIGITYGALSLVLGLGSFFQVHVYADEIYRSVDSSGNVQYSTTPSHLGQKPADLPKIVHEDFDQTLNTIKEKTPTNCIKHGGIDCSRGPDSDGSVVCLDGFRDAVMPFRFSCLEAKLKINTFVLMDHNGNSIDLAAKAPNLKALKAPSKIRISVRNTSNIEAYGVETSLELPGLESFKASGPEKVAPYGIADYTLSLSNLENRVQPQSLAQTKYTLRCTNCTAVVKN